MSVTGTEGVQRYRRSMNLMTAYHVARYFKRLEDSQNPDNDPDFGWTLEKHGPCYIGKRKLLQCLNKNDNLIETIEEMARLGLLVQSGKGERGSAKYLALSVTGREFLNNFLNGLEFVYRVSNQTWTEFANKVDDGSRDRAIELERLLRHYFHGGELVSGRAERVIETVSATDSDLDITS